MSKIKRTAAFFAALLITAAVFVSAGALDGSGLEVSVSCGDLPEPGAEGSLTVQLASLPETGAEEHLTYISFKLIYDPELVTFATDTGYSVAPESSTFSSGLEDRLIFVPNGEQGVVEFCFVDWTTVGSAVTGEGEFRDLFAAGQTVTLDYTLASGFDGTEVVFEITDVRYGVNADIYSDMLLPGAGGTCTAVPAVKYVRGDLTGDDRVTSDDAVYLLRHTLFPNDYPL
ncbi:MAG: hypothetical protein J5760_00240 [Clostridia bacterium]|nr:hypothetical protein [Clostridia bacterium]